MFVRINRERAGQHMSSWSTEWDHLFMVGSCTATSANISGTSWGSSVFLTWVIKEELFVSWRSLINVLYCKFLQKNRMHWSCYAADLMTPDTTFETVQFGKYCGSIFWYSLKALSHNVVSTILQVQCLRLFVCLSLAETNCFLSGW